MKRIITLFVPVFLCLHTTFAQQREVTDILDITTEYFAPLDKSRLETGYLMDLAPPLEAIDYFNGQTAHKKAAINVTRFGMLYAMCMSAQTEATSYAMPAPERTYAAVINRQSDAEPIPFLVLAHRYDKLKDNATEAGLTQMLGNQLEDGPNLTVSPYVQDTVFVATIARREAKQQTVEFTFDPTLSLGNLAQSIESVEADFGNDNGFSKILPYSITSVEYTKPGYKTLQLRINLTNGTTLGSRFVLLVKSKDDSLFKDYSPTPDLNVTNVTGKDEFDADAIADLNIFYADPVCGLTKPLIVVEGFNPDGFNNVNWEEMIRLFEFDYENQAYHADEDGDGEPDDTEPQTLLTELQNGGYDLVYVDFVNGGANLENQAAAVEAAIEEVNRRKNENGSYLPNTILGRSAGGTVARYALLQMQNRGDDHQTDLFVSFDSPFLGGNIPLGVQFLLRDLAEMRVQIFPSEQTLRDAVPLIHDITGAVESEAAKQLLVYNAFNPKALTTFCYEKRNNCFLVVNV